MGKERQCIFSDLQLMTILSVLIYASNSVHLWVQIYAMNFLGFKTILHNLLFWNNFCKHFPSPPKHSTLVWFYLCRFMFLILDDVAKFRRLLTGRQFNLSLYRVKTYNSSRPFNICECRCRLLDLVMELRAPGWDLFSGGISYVCLLQPDWIHMRPDVGLLCGRFFRGGVSLWVWEKVLEKSPSHLIGEGHCLFEKCYDNTHYLCRAKQMFQIILWSALISSVSRKGKVLQQPPLKALDLLS